MQNTNPLLKVGYNYRFGISSQKTSDCLTIMILNKIISSFNDKKKILIVIERKKTLIDIQN